MIYPIERQRFIRKSFWEELETGFFKGTLLTNNIVPRQKWRGTKKNIFFFNHFNNNKFEKKKKCLKNVF